MSTRLAAASQWRLVKRMRIGLLKFLSKTGGKFSGIISFFSLDFNIVPRSYKEHTDFVGLWHKFVSAGTLGV